MSTLMAASSGSKMLRVRAIARRHALALRRSPHRFFDISVWPVVDALLFGALAVFIERQGAGGAVAAGYLISGIILWHVVYQSQIALSTGLLEETWTRNLLNLLVTPLTEVEYVAGVALFGLVKLALGVGLVALASWLMFAFHVTTLGWGLVPVIAILLAVGWVIALFVIGIVLRFGSGAEALAWGILFAIMPLSGVFYPIGALPGFLQPVAQVLPTTHGFAAARALVDGRGLLWGEMALAAVSTLAAALVAIWFSARMLALFRKRGFISRYT